LGRGFSGGGKNLQKEKIKIYWEEELDKFKENMNIVYLETGNMSDILKMCYWRFKDILDTMNKVNKIRSGEQIVETKVPQSNKDLIKNLKNLEEKRHASKK
jgi:methionine synthase II (cobalamin-independent)